MKIETKTGDLLSVTAGWMIQGCNSRGKMNSGIAKAVREKYPKAFEIYEEEYFNRGGSLVLGSNIIYYHDKDLVIVNAITQENYGKDGRKYVSYDAIQSCFEKLNRVITDHPEIPSEIHIPAIGAGLGGGSWNIIQAIIEETSIHPVTLWVLPS